MKSPAPLLERTNRTFESLGRTVVRLRLPIFVIMALMLGIGVAGLTRLKTEISIDSFFLPDDPVMQNKRTFGRIFGNNDFIGILVDSDDVFSSKTLKMIRKLGRELRTRVPFAGKLFSLTDFSYTLPGGVVLNIGDMDIPQDPAALQKIRQTFDKSRYLRGRLYSKDYKQAWIILRMKAYPSRAQWDSPEDPPMYAGRIAMEVLTKYRKQGYKLTPTGVPVLAYRKKTEMMQEMRRVLIVAGIIALFFIIGLLRSVPSVLGTVLVIGSSIALVFGTMGWLGMVAQSTFMLVPMLLTIAVSIGYTIHISSFFRRGFHRTGSRVEALAYTFRETGWPIFFTAVTTIAALLSFLLVPIASIRWVGAVSAVSILVVYLLTMVLYSALLSLGRDGEPHPAEEEASSSRVERMFAGFGHWSGRHSLPIVITFSVVIVVMIFGATRVEVDLNTRKMLGPGLPHVKDQIYVGDSKVGAMYSYDLVLRFGEDGAASKALVLQKMDALSRKIERSPMVRRTTSLCDIVKEFNLISNGGKAEHYRIPSDDKTVAKLVDLYAKAAPADAKTWMATSGRDLRISVEVSDYSSKEFVRHTRMLEQRLAELFPKSRFPKSSHLLAGNLLQISAMNQYITRGQIISYLGALLVITILMIIVFGSIKLGLIAMIPNLTPGIVAAGLMGFMGAPLEFVTMTIAPMVLGLAVDATIHFTNHARLEYSRCGDYDVAISRTFSSVGVALSKTTLIVCMTFAAFLISRVNNMVNMGVFTIAAIITALVADFFVTPALIRAVKPFDAPKRSSKPAESD